MTKRLFIEMPDAQFERWRRHATLEGSTITDWLADQAENHAHNASIQDLPITIPENPDLESVCLENNLSLSFLNDPKNLTTKEKLLGKLYILQVESGIEPCDAGDKLLAKLLNNNHWPCLGIDASTISTPHFIELLHRAQIATQILTDTDTQDGTNEVLKEADQRATEAMSTLKNRLL